MTMYVCSRCTASFPTAADLVAHHQSGFCYRPNGPVRFLVRAFLALTVASLVWGPLAPAHSAGSVQTPAHLEAPRPPYAYTSWTASPGTAQIVLESTWMVRVNCQTGSPIANLGLRQLYSSGSAGPRTMRSNDVQILGGDCIVPAGNITRNGAVLASSVGPTYRF